MFCLKPFVYALKVYVYCMITLLCEPFLRTMYKLSLNKNKKLKYLHLHIEIILPICDCFSKKPLSTRKQNCCLMGSLYACT